MAKSVRQLLDRAREYHRLLAEIYDRLEMVAEDTRVRMLLDYMRSHETKLEACIQEYEAMAEERVLSDWLKFAPEIPSPRPVEDLQLDAAMTVTDVVRVALDFDNALMAFYRQAAENVVSQGVRDLFTALLDQEQQEERIMVRTAMESEIL